MVGEGKAIRYLPVLSSLLAILLYFYGLSVENGYLSSFAWALFAIPLLAYYGRYGQIRNRIAPIGLAISLSGLAMISYGFLTIETGPIAGLELGNVFQTLISPGLHIVLPIGLFTLGLPIRRSGPKGEWRLQVAYFMGIVGLIGILPTVLNWLGFATLAAIGIFGGIVVTVGWPIMAAAALEPSQHVAT